METISTGTTRQEVWARSRVNMSSLASEIKLVARDHELAKAISAYFVQSGNFAEPRITTAFGLSSSHVARAAIIVYLPLLRERGMVPDFSEAERVLNHCAACGVSRFVLVSSAAIYDASFRNPGFVSETHPLPPQDRTSAAIASCWRKLESNAKRHFRDGECLTILRCSTLLSKESGNGIARSFMRRAGITMPGHDPCIQLLAPADLAHAIECVLQTGSTGIFNVAPDGVLPLRQALKQSGTRRIAIPRTILGLVDGIRGKSGAAHLDFKRYCWTVSNERIKAIGFKPRFSSAAALSEFCQRGRPNSTTNRAQPGQFDDFGMDQEYIAFFGRTLFRFLADWYWRIEAAGIENIPQSGRALLAGTHRGFMPWDGVMALDLIVKRTGRYPRFLIHPGLVKFPFLADFMTKLGGIIACQENARRVLENDELLGVFPEGIQGAFVRYSEAYQIHDFHRDAFVKMALRHRAPIVPFVTVGSAEIFPILGKFKSRLFTKYSEWPEFPLTPTFPLLPLPLPSKWHTHFLPAMHVEHDYPASAATNTAIVRAISREVRNRMQKAIDEMLQRRRSIFFGSVFPIGAE